MSTLTAGLHKSSIALIALAFCGCASPQFNGQTVSNPTSGWTLETDTDRITGKTSTSVSTAFSPAKYTGKRRNGFASVTVLCSDGAPKVMFIFDFPVGTSGNSLLSYRFDSKPGVQLASEYFNLKTPVIRDPEQARRFMNDALGSSLLYVRVSSPVGQAETEINTAGGDSAIRTFLSKCSQEVAFQSK